MNASTRWPRGARAGWLLALVVAGPSLADLTNTLTIKGQGRDLGETPIVVESKVSLQPGTYLLTTDDRKTAQLADVFQDEGRTYLATIPESVPARSDLTLKIPDMKLPRTAGLGVEMVEHGRRVEVRINGQPLTTYVPDDGPKPYYFPVFGPTGVRMTRAFPMEKVEGEKYDHPHHRSLWFTFGSVNKVDFWSEVPGHGRIVETSRPTILGGQVQGLIRTTDDWIGPDGKKVCEDERLVRFFATKKGRVVDFEVTLKATEGPVTFGDTKEGMFGLRVPTSMDVTSKKGGKILNSEGIEDVKTWGKPASWVDYSGPVKDQAVGIAILNHPSSFRYPTTWHVRDYGLFAANPFGYKDFGIKQPGEYVLPKGETVSFRYRIILHEGDSKSLDLPGAFRAYEAPPEAVIE